VAGEPVGPEADVYALGLVVLECVTGSPCYSGGHVEAAVARLHRQPEIPPQLPGWLREVLTTMTARNPERRPAASDVATALHRRSGGPVLASTAALDLTAVAAAPATQALPVAGGTRATGTLAGGARALTGTPGTPVGAPTDPTLVDEPAVPVDRTAVLPPSRAPRQDGRLPPPGPASPSGGRHWARASAILVCAVLALLATAALAWTASRDDASSDSPPTSSTVPSTTTVPPTTVTTAPPPTDDQAPAAPSDNGGGDDNGNGKGKGKDKDD
jgi:hypothetical protein